MNNLTDVVEQWLQSKVNDTVAGHSSRIAYLEECVSSLSERLDKLEKAYPDMATTKDLQKDTRAEVLMDKLQPLIEQLLRNGLESYVKHCELEETVTEFLGYRKPINVDDERDAQRYRWLREQRWHDGGIAVVRYSEKNVRIGTSCYSERLLDEMIDKELKK